MAEIIARFADGRLLVQEEKLVETEYSSGGVAVRIGNVKTVERILSLEAFVSGYGEGGRVLAPLKEASTSGDTILVLLRRSDIGSPVMLGFGSGIIAAGVISGIGGASGPGGDLTYALSGGITLTGPMGSGTGAMSVLSGITSGLARYGEVASGLFISGRLNIIANVIAVP